MRMRSQGREAFNIAPQPRLPPYVLHASSSPHLWRQQRAAVDGWVAGRIQASQEGRVQAHHVAVQALHINGHRLSLPPHLWWYGGGARGSCSCVGRRGSKQRVSTKCKTLAVGTSSQEPLPLRPALRPAPRPA